MSAYQVNTYTIQGALKLFIWGALFLFLLSACSHDNSRCDRLNEIAYNYHYRNLDSTAYYAEKAYQLSADYEDGQAEALNHLAFVSIARMDYKKAQRQLSQLTQLTDNQIELLIADVQQMRLCQRQSHNREFYVFRENAKLLLRRINEERQSLTPHCLRRLIYAESEFSIVNSTYYYYVGLERQSIDAINEIDPDGDIQRDTAQYLNYLYNIGAGGIITDGTADDIAQREFDCLMRCFLISSQYNYPFFAANSLEAMSEHLSSADMREKLITNNLPMMRYVNPDGVPDNLLAGTLADNALFLFQQYGDVYQIAGAYRTLASCYRDIGDYQSALFNLEEPLSNHKINQAPDLVASIREQLSVAYSAINDKPASDYNRNIYIDLQEQTRQDRYLEARAAQLDRTSNQLNLMLAAVLLGIVLLLFLVWLFNRVNRRSQRKLSLETLLKPLREWQQHNDQITSDLDERREEINEDYALNVIHIQNNERYNLENRAKISLVNSITPFIDRILNEVHELDKRSEQPATRPERLAYISELTDKINEYNEVLTHWIQLRNGELSLHIESFPLQQLMDIVSKSKMSFHLKGITLQVESTASVVKADRILTLFMINTLADNARKFTPDGGTVRIYAQETTDYVEISVLDTGQGISADKLTNIFNHKVYNGHGFGLMNCRGIIEKYRKISQIFTVCLLSAESSEGEGSRFFFRLPKGIVRILLPLLMLLSSISIQARLSHIRSSQAKESDPKIQIVKPNDNLSKANIYADSAYFSNINGTYSRTLLFADSCRKYLNQHYLVICPRGRDLMIRQGSSSLLSPEIKWFHDSLQTNYHIILDMRNESAVAALALHKWSLYSYNNKVYTQLFKELSADNTLAEYCRNMQRSQNNKTVAIILLVLVLMAILPAYYLIVYRHRLFYRFCVDRINEINQILLSDLSPDNKLSSIEPFAHEQYPDELQHVVNEILKALEMHINSRQQQVTDIELAEDERSRAQYEDNILHISNSVLDNCLSTLKHETMYYPSRIRQLIDTDAKDIQTLSEVVDYYREIYSILSHQAMLQIEHVKLHIQPVSVAGLMNQPQLEEKILGDANMLQYLIEILQKQNGTKQLDTQVTVKDDKYLIMTVKMTQLHLIDKQASQLFTPAIDHLPYLICRQIVRDHSEATNRRGCGILARVEQGSTYIEITFPKAS